MPINASSSNPFWENDTVEVFRVCPEYGVEDTSKTVVVIGRNFRDSDVLGCRFTPCTGTAAGPLKCPNSMLGTTISEGKSILVVATYMSSTRVECSIPEYTFPSNESLVLLDDVCANDNDGILGYIQACEAEEISDGYCEDDAGTGKRFIHDALVSNRDS